MFQPSLFVPVKTFRGNGKQIWFCIMSVDRGARKLLFLVFSIVAQTIHHYLYRKILTNRP